MNGSTGLAMQRLAIIDLKAGQQPIHNEDRTALTTSISESSQTLIRWSQELGLGPGSA